jgi:hypothetical protein
METYTEHIERIEAHDEEAQERAWKEQDYLNNLKKENMETLKIRTIVTHTQEVEIDAKPFMKSKDGNGFFRINPEGRADVIRLYKSIRAFNFECDVIISTELIESSQEEWDAAVNEINEMIK